MTVTAPKLELIEDTGPERPPTGRGARVDAAVGRLAPGLVLALIGATAAQLAGQAVPRMSALVAAVVIGIALGNLGVFDARAEPGLTFAAKRLMRVGVVVLGLRLSAAQLFELGPAVLGVVAVTVGATFFGTQWLGRRLGLSRDLSLLVATGYSICGVSAIAAVKGSTDADEEEVAVAIGLVTLAGSLAIFVVPALAVTLGLGDEVAGAWIGAGIHDVAQVVAAGSAVGSAALSTAVVVKLTRVVLLVPIVAGVNLRHNRSADADRADLGPSITRARPPIIPLFVAGFLIMMAVRSTGLVPDVVTTGARSAEAALFAVALVGLGAGVRLDRIRRLGARPLLFGGLAWLLVGVASLVGAVATHR